MGVAAPDAGFQAAYFLAEVVSFHALGQRLAEQKGSIRAGIRETHISQMQQVLSNGG